MKWFRLRAGKSAGRAEGLNKASGRMKRNRVESKDRNATLVASETAVRGDVHFSGRLYVSGVVIGKITTDEGTSTTLVVDEGGRIEGDIEASHVIVAGRIQGNIVASERVEIASTARVNGDVSYKRLAVEPGGVVNGQVLCVGDDPDRDNVRVIELAGESERDA